MDSFEWNKIAGAVLFALLVSFGLSIVTETIFEREAPETPGYVIAVATSGDDHGAAEAPAATPIATLLANADPAAAESSLKRCATCHTFGEGEPNKIGPNLYGVVMRPIASHEGYEYSEPMHAFAEEAKVWDYDHLNAFLTNPNATVPKTKMAFPGLKDDEERANVIAYLRTLSANPEPLPAPPTDTASTEPMAPAGEATAEAPAAAEQQTAAAEAAPAEAAPAEAAPAEAAPAGQAAAEAPAAETPAAAETAGAAPAEQQAAQAETPAVPESAGANEPVADAAAPAEAPAAGASPVVAAVAAADAAKGETVSKRCIACHTFNEGGANRVGPHLWDVVNRPVASIADFNYSDAMKAFSEGGQKTWTFEELDAFLTDPKAHVPDTKMAFPGLKDDKQRADLLAYLRTLSANPAPLQ